VAENIGRKRHTGLRLIQGGRNEIRFGPLRVIVAPPEAPPFAPAATVLEEDTWLVLSAEPTVKPVTDSMVRIMTDLLAAKPASPGSVMVASGEPKQILGPFEQSGYWVLYKIEELVEPGLDDAIKKNISDHLFARWLQREVVNASA